MRGTHRMLKRSLARRETHQKRGKGESKYTKSIKREGPMKNKRKKRRQDCTRKENEPRPERGRDNLGGKRKRDPIGSITKGSKRSRRRKLYIGCPNAKKKKKGCLTWQKSGSKKTPKKMIKRTWEAKRVEED